jgi:hypothetical protein
MPTVSTPQVTYWLPVSLFATTHWPHAPLRRLPTNHLYLSGDYPLLTCICQVITDWPLLRTSWSIRDYQLTCVSAPEVIMLLSARHLQLSDDYQSSRTPPLWWLSGDYLLTISTSHLIYVDHARPSDGSIWQFHVTSSCQYLTLVTG